MKSIGLPVFLLLCALGLALPVQAQQGPGGGRFMRELQSGMLLSQQDRRDEMPARRDRERQPDSAGDRSGEAARPHRLTPEERRQVRQDIHDAGRDLYRPERSRYPQRRFPPRQNRESSG